MSGLDVPAGTTDARKASGSFPVASEAVPDPGSKANILIVDPEAAYLKLVEMAFKRRGHTVRASAAPDAALQVLEAEPIDLLISELHFPDGGGYRMLEMVRATPATRRLPTIVLTKDRKTRSRVRALEIGADDVVHKPCLLDELFVRAESLVGKWRELFRAAHALRGDLAGKLVALPVAELFPMLEKSRKSGVLRLGEAGEEFARVWWREGQVCDAQLGPLRGEEAVYAILPLRAGNFEFRSDEMFQGTPTITQSVTALLLEGMRRMDETLTFQLLGGRPQIGPRGARIEWFQDTAQQALSRASESRELRERPQPKVVLNLCNAFEQRYRGNPPTPGVNFSDLNEVRNLFKGSLNGNLENTRMVVLSDMEEGLRFMTGLMGPPSPAQLRTGVRSALELYPTGQIMLDDRHRLTLLMAPVRELDVLARSIPGAELFLVMPGGGRWIPPETRGSMKEFLQRALPWVCQPVGDGTVVVGLGGLIHEMGMEAVVAPVIEKPPSNKLEATRLVQRLLRAMAPENAT